jgi:DNA-binding SARP family transcriptional activator
MQPVLRLELVGRSVAYVGERRIDPTAEIVFAALLYLGLERGRRIPRAELAELFWPNVARGVRSARLRWLLTKLRNLGLPLETGATDAFVDWVDVHVDAAKPGAFDETWFSGVLPRYEPGFSSAFRDWVERRRTSLSTALVAAAESQTQNWIHRGEHARALRCAEWIQGMDPANERAALWIADCHCRLGSPAAGITALELFLDAATDLGTDSTLKATLMLRRVRGAQTSGITHRESRFVGRREQLRRVDGLLTSTMHGSGGALMLTGPAGIGKTRLLDEARDRALLAGFQSVRVQCQRGDTIRPLSGVVDLVGQLLELPGAAGCDPEHVSRLRLLAHHDSAPNTSSHEGSPIVLQGRIVDALDDLLDAVSDEAPMLVQVDDVQWLQASVAWIWNELARRSASKRVALLYAARPTRRRPMTLEAPTVSVGALESQAAAEILEDLFAAGERFPTAATRQVILDRGAGSPLFLRELVRQWIAAGDIESLPTSLVALLETALSGLNKSALRTLQVAAILGTYATVERVEAVVQLGRGAFLDGLVELEAAGIFTANSNGTVLGHLLWGEAALSHLSLNLERVLHRHAAELFDAEIKRSPQVPLLWEAARHWERAGHPERARAAILSGGEHLLRNGFTDDAVVAYERALQTLQDPVERLPILERRIRALARSGHPKTVLEAIDEFQSLSVELNPSFETHNDLELLGIRARFASAMDIRDSIRDAYLCSTAQRAPVAHRLAAAKRCAFEAELISPDTVKQLYAQWASFHCRSYEEEWDRYCVEWVYHNGIGDVRVAIGLAEQQIQLARRRNDTQRLPSALQHAAVSYFMAGQVGDGFGSLTEATEMSRLTGDLDTLGVSYDFLIGYALDFESLNVVARRLNEATDTLTRLSNRGGKFMSSIVLPGYHAQLAVMRGDGSRAVELLGNIEQTQSILAPRWRARLMAVQLLAAIQAQNFEKAHRAGAEVAGCFTWPDFWRDWPASVYAAYAAEFLPRDAGSEFAERYVSEWRRELYPPPPDLRRLLRSGHAFVAQ